MRRDLHAAVLLALIVALPAIGCPVCDSPTAEQVRAGIADNDWPIRVLATVLPFAAVLAVTATIHFGRPGGRRNHGN